MIANKEQQEVEEGKEKSSKVGKRTIQSKRRIKNIETAQIIFMIWIK